MFGELGHEALAETHDFGVGLALRVEVGTALAAAHGKGGQGVLEDLLKTKELDDAEVNRRMETDAAFVGANGGVELDAETAVDLDFAIVIDPRYAEDDLSFGLDDALEDAGFDEVGAGIGDRVERLKDLGDGLDELRLVSVAFLDGLEYFDEMLVLHNFQTPFFSILCN